MPVPALSAKQLKSWIRIVDAVNGKEEISFYADLSLAPRGKGEKVCER
jgi:hypothetical protein